MTAASSLLGDTRTRTYVDKLRLFNAFAKQELHQAIALARLHAGDHVLDVGCGTGEICAWLHEIVGAAGSVTGIDLSDAHARRAAFSGQTIAVADATALPFATHSFDGIWCSNTINHLRQPAEALHRMISVLKPGGIVALGQSAFLPEMMFAWDARLEQVVTTACHRYYRDKYGLDERDLTMTRNLIGVMMSAGLTIVHVQTFVIERWAPISAVDEAYFIECVFRGYWGDRVRRYLSDADWHTLQVLCDPASPEYSLRRHDFHHLQTYTVVVGKC